MEPEKCGAVDVSDPPNETAIIWSQDVTCQSEAHPSKLQFLHYSLQSLLHLSTIIPPSFPARKFVSGRSATSDVANFQRNSLSGSGNLAVRSGEHKEKLDNDLGEARGGRGCDFTRLEERLGAKHGTQAPSKSLQNVTDTEYSRQRRCWRIAGQTQTCEASVSHRWPHVQTPRKLHINQGFPRRRDEGCRLWKPSSCTAPSWISTYSFFLVLASLLALSVAARLVRLRNLVALTSCLILNSSI